MRLLVLGGRDRATRILLNWLHDNGFRHVVAIIEDPVSRTVLIRNRFRKLGAWTAIGQLLFQFIVPPVLQRLSRARLQEIMSEHGLRENTASELRVERVDSVNSERTAELVREKNPDVVLVNGTRIIRERLLRSLNCPIVNTHVGVTPFYRGVHGGYWALWNGDCENFGVTLHFVDKGVDTGRILVQVRTRPTKKDNFVTYPLLQQAVSFSALKSLLSDSSLLEGINANNARYSAQQSRADRQWYHPTLWQYLAGALRGVK